MRAIALGALFCVFVVTWAMLGPASLGGPVTYVVTTGKSMEPTIRDGALILVRSPDDYQAGDIAAFHGPDGNLILHRIVGREDGRFVMRGDNNAAPDGFQPTEADMAGELWLHVPAAGSILGGTLWLWALGTAAVLVLAFFALRHARPNLHGGRTVARYPLAQPSRMAPRAVAMTLVVMLTLSGLVLGAIAFSRPLQREHVETFTHVQRGELQYRAPADTALYADGIARSGDPVYRRHADGVDLSFMYSLVSDMPISNVTGTGQIDLVLRAPDGWTATIEIAPPARFQGPDLTIASDILFAEVDEKITELEDVAGLPPNYYDLYELSLVASVSVQGVAGAATVNDEFVSSFDFLLDDFVFRLDSGRPGNEDSTLVTQIPGTTSIAMVVDNRIDPGVFALDVNTARNASVGIVIAGLTSAMILLAGLLLQHRRGRPVVSVAPVAYVTQTEIQPPIRRPGDARTARLTPIRARQDNSGDERPDWEHLAHSLEKISTRIEDHDRNVEARFDEMLDELDHLGSGLPSDINHRSSANTGQHQGSDEPPKLRPIRLRTRADRMKSEGRDHVASSDDSSRSGA